MIQAISITTTNVFRDIPTEIEFDQFGSADMMCLGAAPCGAAPFGGAPFGGIMVSDHCEARKLSFVPSIWY